jgi:hypothetical protein
MELADVSKLFRKACVKNRWGENSYIHMLDDGGGEVVSEDEEYEGEVVFEFYTPEDLIKKLKESIK